MQIPPSGPGTPHGTVSGQHVSVTTPGGDALRQAQAASTGNPLETFDVQQALAWIDATVIDIPSARIVLKALAAFAVLQRDDLTRTKTAILDQV